MEIILDTDIVLGSVWSPHVYNFVTYANGSVEEKLANLYGATIIKRENIWDDWIIRFPDHETLILFKLSWS